MDATIPSHQETPCLPYAIFIYLFPKSTNQNFALFAGVHHIEEYILEDSIYFFMAYQNKSKFIVKHQKQFCNCKNISPIIRNI